MLRNSILVPFYASNVFGHSYFIMHKLIYSILPSIGVCFHFFSIKVWVELMLQLIRSWIDHRSWSLYFGRDSCQTADRPWSRCLVPNRWNCSCTFCILLCGARMSLSCCWECLSLHLHMCRRRVTEKSIFLRYLYAVI